MGPNHLDLDQPSGVRLVPSPHGRALDVSSLPPGRADSTATTDGGAMPRALRWQTTGMQTIEARILLDSAGSDGVILFGSYQGPRVSVTTCRAVMVSMQTRVPGLTDPVWQGVVTAPGVLSPCRWTDLAVSIDRATQQIYVWVDGMPQEMYSIQNQVQTTDYVDDSIAPFSIGGGAWDSRKGTFRIDEVRISDTLVFGRGIPMQPEFAIDIPLLDAGIRQNGSSDSVAVDTTSTTFSVGSVVGATGRWWAKAFVPKSLMGRRILFANLSAWSAQSPEVTRKFQVHRVLASWELGQAGFGIEGNGAVDPVAATPAWLMAPSTGGISGDFSGLLQGWVDDSTSNHGFLLESADESDPAVTINGSRVAGVPKSWVPVLKVYYK
jgi:hypothetical protein